MKQIFATLTIACLLVGLAGRHAEAADKAAEKASSDKAATQPAPSADGTFMLADFDSWEEVNNLGGLFSSWTRDPTDTSQGCRVEITDDDRWGEKGLSVRLIYDVESPGIAFNGMWMQLQEVDFSPYKNLVIHVRGDREAGFTPRFKIELKNKQKEVGRYVVSGVTDDWQEYVIPLSNFKGMGNFKVMKELTVTFDDMRCSPKLGEIYLDNIFLSK